MKKKERKSAISELRFCIDMRSAVYRAALPHRYTLLYTTQKSRYLKFRRASAPYMYIDQARGCCVFFLAEHNTPLSGVAYSCSYVLLSLFCRTSILFFHCLSFHSSCRVRLATSNQIENVFREVISGVLCSFWHDVRHVVSTVRLS